jgi:hypothetical protein
MLRSGWVALGVGVAIISCGGSAVIDAEGDGSGGTSSASSSASVTGSVASSTTGGGGCAHRQPPAGLLCVHGELQPNGSEELIPGMPVRIEVRPVGCFSSSCTEVHESSCSVMPISEAEHQASASFCVEDTSAMMGGCTADCGGVPAAACFTEPLAEGGYSVTLDGLTVLFTLPMTTPPGGACTSSAF